MRDKQSAKVFLNSQKFSLQNFVGWAGNLRKFSLFATLF